MCILQFKYLYKLPNIDVIFVRTTTTTTKPLSYVSCQWVRFKFVCQTMDDNKKKKFPQILNEMVATISFVATVTDCSLLFLFFSKIFRDYTVR